MVSAKQSNNFIGKNTNAMKSKSIEWNLNGFVISEEQTNPAVKSV